MSGVTDVPTPQPFAYLGTPNESLYAGVLGVFALAKQRFTVHLRPEDVLADWPGTADGDDGPAAAYRPDSDQLVQALDKLVEWGNLRSDADTGRVTSVEDFNRARKIYQLTRHGQAALAAIEHYEQALGQRGRLQTVALADIAGQLAALVVHAESSDPPDQAGVGLLLFALTERFTGLADNAEAFMSSLRRAVDFTDGDEDAFLAYKDRLIEYIDKFIADLANRGAQIAGLIERVEAAGIGRVLEAAALRDAVDAVPDPHADTDAFDIYTAAVATAARDWENRWRGLREWFVSIGARRPSQARLLRNAAVSGITNLINAVAALNERRGGRSDRSADFRALARFFAQAPDDAAAHRLWRAAFALAPARHLSLDAQTEDVWEQAEYPPGTPWADAEPLLISPRLRETGSYERRGAPNKAIDREAGRRLLTEKAEREAAEISQARRLLTTDGPVLLSELAGPDGLDQRAFRLFLAVLGDALAARRPGATTTTATSGDGTMEIRLKLVDAARTVTIPTDDGVLSGPEHVIEIIDLTVREAAAR
ncbi:TIGR02677 family protein [Catenulispora sp. NF23]|uniref:TIGR02677 family protein n=1 Tax=Catenulispora pinistramenti TaxID=2705254 RepID=A0ABS5KKF6_9ACTN|nr:TIGR02677 family protein [Catenulispora pinistramenti]MBS2535916.1 TIGR02677 family protein [Catenulispora pinistramenti]MBS2546274.1 TIGR02677 family protein [Catenulispora pinistramenti]